MIPPPLFAHADDSKPVVLRLCSFVKLCCGTVEL